MARAEVDSNLLFGILALQAGLIEQADLFDAFQRWSRDRTRPRAQILIDRAALTVEDRTALESLVARHLAKHGGDVDRSLSAAAPSPTVVAGLMKIAEPDLEASVAQFASNSAGRVGVGAGMLASRSELGDDLDATTDAPPGLGQGSTAGNRFRLLRPHARGGIGSVNTALLQYVGSRQRASRCSVSVPQAPAR
jgi:hypothetical protein